MRLIGKLDAKHRLTVVRRLWGQSSIGPSGVTDQSFERINSPMIPPPIKNSDLAGERRAPDSFGIAKNLY